jgi:hypothetical protein
MALVGIGWLGGHAALADGPNGLVGQENLRRRAGDTGQRGRDLPCEDLVGAGRGLVLRVLADADQGSQAASQGGRDLEPNRLVGFPEVRPPLAVSELHQGRAAVCDLGHGDLAGPGPASLPVTVLRADPDRAALKRGADLG